MTNEEIADVFDQIGDLLEFQGANSFRVRAYRNGARAIRDLPESVQSIVAQEAMPLTEIEGIGKDLAQKCQELITTGKLDQLEELHAQVPASVLSLMRVPGLGPKKAAVLHRELNVATLDDLRAVCQQQKVRALKGFGEKTEQLILKGLAIADSADRRMMWAEADAIVARLKAHFETCDAVIKLEFAGSYRRRKETIGDLDILVTASDDGAVMDHLGAFEAVSEVIVRGGTKMSVRVKAGVQVDLRVVPESSFGAAMQYFTGSKEHNVHVRTIAKQRGLRVNEYGVYPEEGDGELGSAVAGVTEEEVYRALGLAWIPPELREARGEIEQAARGSLPKLVRLEDIQGDLHMHTMYTDGKATVREMAQAAQARGLQYVAITDHSQRVSMAMGLDEQRLIAQWQEIDSVNRQLEGITILKGIECDILEQGGMDLPDAVLARADWVLASVHYGQQQSRAQITDRVVSALKNPHVDAIAHPTGRLIGQREPYAVDMDAVLQVAAENHKLLELNAHPKRLDLNDVHCAAAKHHGIQIVISTDAHAEKQLNLMRFGVQQARRGGLTKDDVANTRPLGDFMRLIQREA